MEILTRLRGAANGGNDGEAMPKQRRTTARGGERHTGDGKDRSRPEGERREAITGQTTASRSEGVSTGGEGRT
jgi:hypothetical protein